MNRTSRCILAFDQGTTSSRAILFDADGAAIAMAQMEFPQIFPQSGWVEHDPMIIWSTQLGVGAEVLAKANKTFADVAAIGITNQRETAIVWEKATGKPIYNAIVWQDRRTAEACSRLTESGYAAMVREKTGLLPDAYFSGTKIAWILYTVPDALKRAERGELLFGTVDTWLLWRLTGGKVHATDPSNASRTMLYNINTGEWDKELLALFGIPAAMLPDVCPSSSLFGETDPSVYGAAIPITGIAGDQQAAAFGQACHKPGMAKNTYGTGCFLLLNTGATPVRSHNKLLSTVAWQRGNAPMVYALEGTVFTAGAAVQWLRDGLGIISASSEVEGLASTVPDSGGVVLVPAFTGLGAPYWDPYARGTLQGISRGTNKAHIARATLEGIAFQVYSILTAMQEDTRYPLRELRVDGGASLNNLLMQFQADILNLPVIRPKMTETTALGAAYLAGLTVGFWASEEDIASQWQEEVRFDPSMGDDRRKELLETWDKAVSRSLAWRGAYT